MSWTRVFRLVWSALGKPTGWEKTGLVSDSRENAEGPRTEVRGPSQDFAALAAGIRSS